MLPGARAPGSSSLSTGETCPSDVGYGQAREEGQHRYEEMALKGVCVGGGGWRDGFFSSSISASSSPALGLEKVSTLWVPISREDHPRTFWHYHSKRLSLQPPQSGKLKINEERTPSPGTLGSAAKPG